MTRLADESDRLAVSLADVLGTDLVGVYLHGSAVLGGWVAGASDLDVLVVASSDGCDADAVLAACRRVRSPVELSVITAESAAHPVAPWPFIVHVTTRPDKCMRDTGAGDPDLLLHIAVTRAHGQAVIGPKPRDVFGPIPDESIADNLSSELQWGVDHGTKPYAVLNACRALCWSRTGRLVSKVDGGLWAMPLFPDHEPLIEQALAGQRAGTGCDVAAAEVQALVDVVRAELRTTRGEQ